MESNDILFLGCVVALLMTLIVTIDSYQVTQRTYIKEGYIQEQKAGTTEVMWVKP